MILIVEKKPKIEEPEIPCTLDERIQNLLKLICDINTMKQTCIELEYDTTRAPPATAVCEAHTTADMPANCVQNEYLASDITCVFV
jgi:hypothetical protein